jgi:muramoyltetrapeptide carboxypeptidase LdcA involved in peptidoglycan recycling
VTEAPPRVRGGDTVAIVSPSAPAVGRWPHRVERATAYLRSLGLEVELMPNAAEQTGWLAGSPQQRADDLHRAFADERVSVVLCGIGGNHSNQLLPHLDFDLVRAHPKVFQGYSDITVLHWAFLKWSGLRTFHGPALTTELAEFPAVLPYTDRALRAAWFGEQPLRFEAAGEWTDERLDFDTRADRTRPRELRPGDGWVTLRDGAAEGPLLGGCLETILWHLKGSSAWLDLDGAILFLETSEEAPSPAHVQAYLTDLAHLGVFETVAGLVWARPYGYDEERARTLWEVVREATAGAELPVLANVECGHTSPMLTLPLGAAARLDAGAQTFETLEPATRA